MQEGSVRNQAASAIRSLGTSGFVSAFSSMARGLFLADQVMVYAVDAGGQPQPLLFDNLIDGPGRARQLVDRYVSRYWSQDPNRDLLQLMGPSSAVRVTRSEDIPDSEYRRLLFSDAGLGSKAALFLRSADRLLYVNLYRSVDRAPFVEAELAAQRDNIDLLGALLEKHAEILHAQGLDEEQRVHRILTKLAQLRGEPLSQREAFVLTQIVLGRQISQLAEELGVSEHSVISYRRRGYLKLDVTSQRALVSLVLQNQSLATGADAQPELRASNRRACAANA